MNAEELYQEIILRHLREPQNKRDCPTCLQRQHEHNPVCGDDVLLMIKLADGRIEDIYFLGQGCAISQASASMLTQIIKDKTIEEAWQLAKKMRELMDGQSSDSALGELQALGSVTKYPTRIKCVLLPWQALQKILLPLRHNA